MSRNSEFIPKVNVQPQDTIDQKEVEDVESRFSNNLDDFYPGGDEFNSDKCYSIAFIDRVKKRAEELHHDVPEAIFNLINRSNGERILWCTYDIKDIAYLCNCYYFGSKADALACKDQLEQLKQRMFKEKYQDELLMMNIERALKDVEAQLKEFDDLSK